MAKYCLIALLLAAQSMSCSGAFVRVQNVETSLRVQSNSSHFSLWNNAIANRIQHEIEMPKAKPPKVNKIFWVVFAMCFGICGCDRCFMGQILLGCCKGFTFGGFLIWHLVDYFVCIVSAFQKSDKIEMVGYNHVFEKSSIEGAFYLAAILLLLQIVQHCNSTRAAKANFDLQREQQEKMLKAIGEMNKEGSENKESLDIPRRHQSMSYMPTMLTKGLRKAGVVTEKPTIPELISLFDKMDKDGDGQLDHEEIKEGLSAMGVTDETVDEMIKSADADGDGKISKDEWLINMTQKQEQEQEQKAN